MVSRRALLTALPAAAVLPTVAPQAQDPADRVVQLMQALSVALGDYLDGSFRAVVDPSTEPGGIFMLQNTGQVYPPSSDGRTPGIQTAALSDLG